MIDDRQVYNSMPVIRLEQARNDIGTYYLVTFVAPMIAAYYCIPRLCPPGLLSLKPGYKFSLSVLYSY